MLSALLLIHFLVIAAITAFTGLGVSIGQGILSRSAFAAINRQPAIKSDINRTTLIALALTETAALLGLVFAILLFLKTPTNQYAALAELGIGFALALPGFIIGIVSALPARTGLLSIARQPFISRKITNLILLLQSLIQTPLIFGFVLAFVIRAQLDSITTLGQGLTFLASGLCVGLGSIGPLIGSGIFTQNACFTVGLNKQGYSKVLSFTVISQAIIETPILFSGVIAFWLVTVARHPLSTTAGIIYLAAACAMAVGTFSAGISSGRTARAAGDQIILNLNNYASLSRTSLFAQAFIDTCVIYAFIVALMLILTPLA